MAGRDFKTLLGEAQRVLLEGLRAKEGKRTRGCERLGVTGGELERDEEFEKLRSLPQAQVISDTWVVKLTS